MADPHEQPAEDKTAFNQTAIAIGGSLVISVVLATVFTGNPITAVRRAYTNYTVPAASAPVDNPNAPRPSTPPQTQSGNPPAPELSRH